MPRGPRLDAPLALHHVWNRGIERCDIFRDDTDRLDFLARIQAAVRAKHFAVYAWALMSNHFHLLTQTGNLGLSAAMRVIEGGYATSFNKRHRRSGHLFQNRFKNVLVGEDPYLLELLRYIHLNPVRAGIVAGLDELDRYACTGHAAMMGNRIVPWHDHNFGLVMFGVDFTEARNAYRSFVADGLNYPEPNLDGGGLRRSLGLWQRLNPMRRGREAWSFDERIYGSSEFVDSVLADINADDTLEPRPPDAGQLLHHLVEQLARLTGLQPAELRSNSKRPSIVQARRALCYLAVRHAALPARQVALHLGVRPYAVLRCAAGGEQALRKIGCRAAELLASTAHPR